MIKPGVKLHPTTVWAVAMPIIREVYQDFGYVAVITSGIDGKHSTNSLHYSGMAFDFRTRDVKPVDLPHLFATLGQSLGDNFDVVLEKDHIHIEYDP